MREKTRIVRRTFGVAGQCGNGSRDGVQHRGKRKTKRSSSMGGGSGWGRKSLVRACFKKSGIEGEGAKKNMDGVQA